MNKFQPMLSGKISNESDLDKIIYPVIASPKIDGIRCLIHPELGAVTRKLKAIPNLTTRINLTRSKNIPNCLDGELVNAIEPHNFQMTSSAVMSLGGIPQLIYYVFDNFEQPNKPYYERLQRLDFLDNEIVDNVKIKVLDKSIIYDKEGLLLYEEQCLSEGYEGIMIRNPNMPYKYGRSAITKTQQHLIKLKRFEDAEGKIIGFTELQRNQNELQYDNLGYAKRSTCKDGKVAGNCMGEVEVEILNGEFSGKTVEVGSGFTQQQREEIWNNRDNGYLGRIVKFKYLPIGCKDKPRHPIFLGFRED